MQRVCCLHSERIAWCMKSLHCLHSERTAWGLEVGTGRKEGRKRKPYLSRSFSAALTLAVSWSVFLFCFFKQINKTKLITWFLMPSQPRWQYQDDSTRKKNKTHTHTHTHKTKKHPQQQHKVVNTNAAKIRKPLKKLDQRWIQNLNIQPEVDAHFCIKSNKN